MKTFEILDKELTRKLAKIAFWFNETYGMPIEIFKEEMKKRMSQPRINYWKFVRDFEKDYPNYMN